MSYNGSSAIKQEFVPGDHPIATRRFGLLWSLSDKLLLFGLLIIATLTMTFLSSHFLTMQNLQFLLKQSIEIGIIALPMTLIIIAGGIDLSVSSLVALVAAVVGTSWQQWGVPLWIAGILGLLISALCGGFNGFMITRYKVPDLIVTLASLSLFQGLALGISQARPVSGLPDWALTLGGASLGPFPIPFLIFLFLAAIYWIVLHRTAFGRMIYAIGSNENIARYSGIRTKVIRFRLYLMSGITTGLAAIIYISRVATARPDAGANFNLDAITAVVLGGTSIFGGRGNIYGTIVGWLIISIVKNGLLLANISTFIQTMIVGGVLIASIFLYGIVLRRKG